MNASEPNPGIAGKRIAIANRGEIAVRIAKTCTRMSAIPTLLLGEPDLNGYAARQVGRVEGVGAAGAELDVDCVIAAARRAHADYLHPGYGFLSERAALAGACQRADITFIGPSAATLHLFGDKLATRALAANAGVPVVTASPPLDDEPEHWLSAARDVGFPLMVKPSEAGGGRGLRHVDAAGDLVAAVQASRREGASAGAGAVIYLERELIEPRHIEVQVVADATSTFALGDRDCSLQRRHQKVIEEAPAPNVSDATRRSLHDYACRVANEAGLRGIATCEFLLGAGEEIAFLEVNPRIQVEHPVTELVTGVDLVEWQLLIASGNQVSHYVRWEPRGHAIEARVYAEDPGAGFVPTAGKLGPVVWPTGPAIRVDAGYASDDAVPAVYDAMLAKLIAHGASRDAALAALRQALIESVVSGVATNVGWLIDLLNDGAVQKGRASTATATRVAPTARDRGLSPVAIVAQTLDHVSVDASDPWSAIGPWRSSGRATVTVHGDVWEQRVTVWREPAGWGATVDDSGDTVRWWRDATGIWTIAAGDTVAHFAVMEHGDEFDVYGNGGHWSMRIGPMPTTRSGRKERRSDGLVRAPLPASVVGIHVAAGDRVTRGQPLVTLSAMKMELVCEAPIDALVSSVSCRQDELVSADQVLVTLAPDGQ